MERRVSQPLHNTIRHWRMQKGLTQAQLAEAAGVSRKTVNTVENGIFIPSTVLALKLARVFGCKVEDLFSLD